MDRIITTLNQSVNFKGALPPLSVYVHVPWCIRKCPYCDFNSHEVTGNIPEELYLQALTAEIEQVLPQIWGRTVYSIFLGGGTPSLLSEKGLDGLLTTLRNLLNVPAGIEITMEANPGVAEATRFKSYAASGINRLSLGIQSFNNRSLRALGRVHNAEQAKKAIGWAQQAVDRINLDLMYGLPFQDLNACKLDLDTALSFATEHLSLYNLTLEPNTVFAKYPPPALPNDELINDMLDYISQATQAQGYERYEVSAYAKNHAYARHNLNYWRFGDYLGLGPGAHGKISFGNKILRTANLRSPSNWMNNALKYDNSHRAEEREVTLSEIPFEFMLNVLRLRQGVPSYLFEQHTGLSITCMQKQINRALEKGLLTTDPTRLQASELGWRFLNDLQEIFLN